MNKESARTMMWAALVLLLAGAMIGAPEAGMLVALLAACCALAAAVYGSKGTRIAAAVILLAALGLSIALYPAANRDMAAYRDRAPDAVSPGTGATR